MSDGMSGINFSSPSTKYNSSIDNLNNLDSPVSDKTKDEDRLDEKLIQELIESGIDPELSKALQQHQNNPKNLGSFFDGQLKKNTGLSADDRKKVAGSLVYVFTSGQLSITQIMQAMEQEMRKLSQEQKKMANEMEQTQVQLRVDVRKKNIEAAQKEKDNTVKKAALTAGMSIGAAMLPAVTEGLGKGIKFKYGKKAAAAEKSGKLDVAEKFNEKAKGFNESKTKKGLDLLGRSIGQAGSASAPQIAEAITSGETKNINVERSNADYLKSVMDSVSKNVDKFNNLSDESRKRVAELCGQAVNLSSQAMQSVSFRT